MNAEKFELSVETPVRFRSAIRGFKIPKGLRIQLIQKTDKGLQIKLGIPTSAKKGGNKKDERFMEFPAAFRRMVGTTQEIRSAKRNEKFSGKVVNLRWADDIPVIKAGKITTQTRQGIQLCLKDEKGNKKWTPPFVAHTRTKKAKPEPAAEPTPQPAPAKKTTPKVTAKKTVNKKPAAKKTAKKK